MDDRPQTTDHRGVAQAVSLYRPGGRRYTGDKGSTGCQPVPAWRPALHG